MGDEQTSMEGGPYIKTELPPLIPSRPPGLLPLPGRDLRDAMQDNQDSKQVQAAMAMAAIYSQSPWAAMAAMAQQRERLQQLHATVPHPAAQAISQGQRNLAGMHGLNLHSILSSSTPSQGLGHLQGLPGAQQVLEHSRQQDLIRDYLTKLAQSTLNVSTSLGQAPSGPGSPQYLQSFSTSSSADTKTEKPMPASVRSSCSPSTKITSNTRSPPPSSMGYGSPYFPSVSASGGHPYFSAMRHASPTEAKPVSSTPTRSPPSGGRRNGGVNGREKVFTCTTCNRSFGYKHVLQNHERTHTGEKPFECKECHKRFTRDHHLKTHMRLHTGEKPYSCTHCDRQFVQVANLRRHLRVHTGERPYKCELCPSNFSDSNQLKAHNLIHKDREPPPNDLHRPSFADLKEELLFRHSLATGFPLPQYPPPGMSRSGQEEILSQASMSPDSKETGSIRDSPGHGENCSDSNSEKKRSRKQKRPKMIWGEDGSPGDDGLRDRHVSSSTFHRGQLHHSMQQEPEDLSVRAKAEDDGDDARMMDSELPYIYRLQAAQAHAQEKRNSSDGSLASFSDPQSSSLLKDDGVEDDKEEEEDRGVSPPMSSPHPGIFSPFPIQLGLSGAALPLPHDMRERDGEMLAMVAQKEISQQ